MVRHSCMCLHRALQETRVSGFLTLNGLLAAASPRRRTSGCRMLECYLREQDDSPRVQCDHEFPADWNIFPCHFVADTLTPLRRLGVF